ncbi:MAG: 50S ribosomal protein L25 [Tissierellia bacterium]|nr:50S ribosomal protein L25 [Tissierellia bacterium]
MTALKMQVEKREEIGKNAIKKLRKDHIIPAVIYGKGEENLNVKIELSEFLRVSRAAGTSSVLDLDLAGETIPVIIKDIHRHPVKDQILHIDFQKLNMHEKVRLTIPIVLLNRDSIRLQPSVLTQLLDQIEIECLPAHIPGSAQVDVQDMDFATPITVKDLDIASDENINILRDLDDAVCTLSQPAAPAEDEEADEAEATEAPEATEASENQME